mgnify:CR=1 FL=1
MLGIHDINIWVGQPTDYVHPMQGLYILALLLAEHDATHWEMSCAEWNQNRIEILSDKNHTPDAKEYLIDYFFTKVPDQDCKPYTLGRK